MVTKTRPTAAQLAKVKAAAQASAVAEGRGHVLEEDREYLEARSQVERTTAASAKAKAKEAKLRKAGLLQFQKPVTEEEVMAELEAARKNG